MRTLFLSFALCLFAQLSHAITQLELQPLSIQSQSQVLGVQAGPQAQKAIIFTGQAAEQVAEASGFTIDSTRQMIVMTGAETNSLVGSAIGTTYTAGKLVLISSANFASAATKLALNMVRAGVGVVWLGISSAATLGKTIVYFTLKGLQTSYYLIGGTGVFLVRATESAIVGTLRFVCNIPNYFGLGMLRCR